MSTIRKVRPWEEHLILPLCESFHKETGFGSNFSSERISAMLRSHKHVLVGAFDDNGTLIGVLIGLLSLQFLTNAMIAQEVVWYVDPDYRGLMGHAEMLQSFEIWAAENGANAIALASLTSGSSSVPRFYEAQGYVEIEKHHLKLIQ